MSQTRKKGASRPRGAVISRVPSRPPCAKDPAEFSDACREILDISHTEADGGRVEQHVSEREGEHVAVHELELGCPSSARARASVGEVETDDDCAVRARLDREIAGAAARVERPVAGYALPARR